MPIKKKMSKRVSKHIKKNTVTATNPPMPVDGDNEKPKRPKYMERRKVKNRANTLKQTYPDMKNIPRTLTKKHRAALVQVYKRSRTGLQAAQELPNQGGSLVKNGSRIKSTPEVSEDRRKEVARNLGGMSNSDPICID